MLEFVLTGLLMFQTASGSPGVRQPGSTTTTGAQQPQPTATPRGRRGPSPSATPTPEPTPTPTPKPSNDVLVVVNKSDNSLSVLDAGNVPKLGELVLRIVGAARS